MSFFDTFQDIGGGDWVSSDEKDIIIAEGIPFEITSVVDDDGNKYGPRFVLGLLLPNPETGDVEERKIGFAKASVESRDRMLIAMQAYFGSDESSPVEVKLEKVGNAVLIRKAE